MSTHPSPETPNPEKILGIDQADAKNIFSSINHCLISLDKGNLSDDFTKTESRKLKENEIKKAGWTDWQYAVFRTYNSIDAELDHVNVAELELSAVLRTDRRPDNPIIMDTKLLRILRKVNEMGTETYWGEIERLHIDKSTGMEIQRVTPKGALEAYLRKIESNEAENKIMDVFTIGEGMAIVKLLRHL